MNQKGNYYAVFSYSFQRLFTVLLSIYCNDKNCQREGDASVGEKKKKREQSTAGQKTQVTVDRCQKLMFLTSIGIVIKRNATTERLILLEKDGNYAFNPKTTKK